MDDLITPATRIERPSEIAVGFDAQSRSREARQLFFFVGFEDFTVDGGSTMWSASSAVTHM